MPNNQTKPNQTQTTPSTRARGISRGRVSVTSEHRDPHSLPASTRPSDEAEAAWGDVLAYLAARLDETTFAQWIKPCRCVGSSGEALCLEAPPPVAQWTRRRYGSFIGDAIREFTSYSGAHIGNATAEPKRGARWAAA